MQITNYEDFLTLIKGSVFLASGGGGSYSKAKNIAKYYLENKQFNINIISVDELNTNSWGCVAAAMGSPAAVEKANLPISDFVDPTVNAVNLMQKLLKSSLYDTKRYEGFNKFDTLAPIEIGAMNVAIPLISAMNLSANGDSVNVIDGDMAGRSVPTIDLSTFATNIDVMPNMATSQAVDNKSDFSVLSVESYSDLNDAYAKLVGAGLLGLNTGLSLAPMNANELKENTLQNSLSDAYKIGKILETNYEGNGSVGIDAWDKRCNDISKVLKSSNRKLKVICEGYVCAYETETINNNDVGFMSIKTPSNRTFTLSIQNETITGQFEDETDVIVTGPDAICYLSTDSGALPEDRIYDNTLIQSQFDEYVKDPKEENKVRIAIVAIEAYESILNNQKLMQSWNKTYKKARYYGTYSKHLWTKN